MKQKENLNGYGQTTCSQYFAIVIVLFIACYSMCKSDDMKKEFDRRYLPQQHKTKNI